MTDVARAFADALEKPGISGETINIGSGVDRSILEIANELAKAMGKDISPEVIGKSRVGDIRHCFCDTGLATSSLGFTSRQDFGEGLADLASWVADQKVAEDNVSRMRAELEKRGLVS